MRERTIRNVEEILELSFRYLAEHGLENTSMRDLCNGIGISLGSTYYWFESKEDIVVSTAEYGLTKVAGILFEYAFDTMHDLKTLFDGFLDVVKEHQPELRFVYQVATSPVYGDRIRKKAEGLHETYEKYIKRLSELLKIQYEDLVPIVFMAISTILDFIVWDDYAVSKIQLDYLYSVLNNMREKNN